MEKLVIAYGLLWQFVTIFFFFNMTINFGMYVTFALYSFFFPLLVNIFLLIISHEHVI
jgi:hypothetical protein